MQSLGTYFFYIFQDKSMLLCTIIFLLKLVSSYDYLEVTSSSLPLIHISIVSRLLLLWTAPPSILFFPISSTLILQTGVHGQVLLLDIYQIWLGFQVHKYFNFDCLENKTIFKTGLLMYTSTSDISRHHRYTSSPTLLFQT